MKDKIEYAANVDKSGDQRKSWFAHIQDLRIKKIRADLRYAEMRCEQMERDPKNAAKAAKLENEILKLRLKLNALEKKDK